MGQGKTKQEVKCIVRKIIERKGRQAESFNGEGWWYGFMKRHPELSISALVSSTFILLLKYNDTRNL